MSKNMTFLLTDSSQDQSSAGTDMKKKSFEGCARTLGMNTTVLVCDQTDKIRDVLSGHICNGKADFDGVFCSSDPAAMAVVRVLREEGLRVPEDIKVIGCGALRTPDNSAYICTSVEIPLDAIAQSCADLITDGSRKYRPSKIVLPVRLVNGNTI